MFIVAPPPASLNDSLPYPSNTAFPMNTITSPFKYSFIFATLALFLVGTGWLQAGSAGIRDDAGFFSAAAKADAQGNITLAQRTLHKDVQVETLPTLPDTLKSGVNLQDKAAVNRAYEQWVNKRAESLGVDGVYILIVKDPAHLQVAVGNDTQKQAFTLADRDSLVKLMVDKLRAKDYDAALRQGVSYVVSTMKQHSPGHARNYGTTAGATNTNASNNLPWNSSAAHKTAPAEKSGFPWGWIIALVVIFLIIRLIGGVLGAIFRGGSSGMPGSGMPMGGGGYGGYPPSGGGGGFMRSLMGGVLGAAAGSWMYDNFFGSHGSSSYGASPPPGGYDGGSQDGGYTGHDTSFSSSGSDYDSGGGGGGFDSGSSGGGSDFGGGGGDFGGGGDSGGGGSDF